MNILLTKKLPQDNIDLIRLWGWNFETVETLEITPIEVKEVPTGADAWILSSRNSLMTVKKFIKAAPGFIYCIGSWIQDELTKSGVSALVKSFINMKSLAVDLGKQDFKKVIYFCGEEHRQELEDGLKNSSTEISKVITHQSAMMFPEINKSYDVVFVFSPRSAESLLTHNTVSPETIFACIGKTTSAYLHERGMTNTFVASQPDSKMLLTEYHSQILNIKS